MSINIFPSKNTFKEKNMDNEPNLEKSVAALARYANRIKVETSKDELIEQVKDLLYGIQLINDVRVAVLRSELKHKINYTGIEIKFR